MKITMGQLLINEALPEDLRDYNRHWDKSTGEKVLQQIAENNPEEYKDALTKLLRVGQSASTTGNISYKLADFMPSKAKKATTARLKAEIAKIINNPKVSDSERDLSVVELLAGSIDPMIKEIMAEKLAEGSRLAEIVHAGSKGKPGQYNTSVGAPLLYTDHNGDPVPIPVFGNAAEGLDPVEFFASTFGTRLGLISTKFATADSGDFGNRLTRAVHRVVVTEDDCGTDNGILTKGGDAGNVGSVLAKDTGKFTAGTIVTPEISKKIKEDDVIVRSATTCQASNGICAHCAGITDRRTLPDIGDNVGIPAAQTVAERISQGMLNTKHTGGAMSGAKKSYGFQDVDRLFSMPKKFPGSAKLAHVDGEVKSISESEIGGFIVTVGDQTIHTEADDELVVKVGDRIEAGDKVTEGILNPKELAIYKGIGEARNRFVDEVLKVTGNSTSRRNAEAIARGVVSHVRINDIDVAEGTLPGDIVRYDELIRNYKPRANSYDAPVARAKGKYLEKPALHYTIGSRVDNRMLGNLKRAKIDNLFVNDEAPGFTPDVKRIYEHMQLDPDWMVRLGGYGLKTSLLDATHTGATSEMHSTSYFPSLAQGVDFAVDIDKGTY